MAQWHDFPHPRDAYEYPADALKASWERLHRGDREPFPDADYVDSVAHEHPGAIAASAHAEALAEQLQAAWRHYHRGDFQRAWDLGLSLGPIGYTAAARAALIHATYLEEAEERKLEQFSEAAQRAAAAADAMPAHANAHYLHAAALGRYSQGISVVQALAQGLASKIKAGLEKALALESLHAEAHTALALYHAEIIDSVGAVVGGLTYGAKKSVGMDHFREALELTPNAAIAHIEYGNGLIMLFGDEKLTEATAAYREALRKTPADAMAHLDQAFARSELE